MAIGLPPKVVVWMYGFSMNGSNTSGVEMKQPHGDDGAAERLAHRHDVGRDAPVLDAPQRARAPHAGLHLVGDEEDAPLVADLAHLGEEVVGRHVGAGLALYGLGDEGGDVETDRVADLELLVERVGVAVGDEAHVGRERVEGLAPGSLAGDAQAAERLAVKAAAGS